MERVLAGRRLPVAVAALALLAGLAAWRPAPLGIWHDDGFYALLSRALAGGDGYRLVGVPGSPCTGHFPPAYPALLAPLWWMAPTTDAFGRLAVGLNMLLLAAAAVAFAGYVRDRLRLGVGVALMATVAGWLYLPLWFTAYVPLSEPLFLLLLVLMLARLARLDHDDGAAIGVRSWAALVALLLLLLHTRTAGAAFVLGAVAGLALRRGPLRAALVAAATAAGALPWWWWSRRANAAIPEPLRDILGSYGGLFGERFSADPGAFLAALPAAALHLASGLARALLPGLPAGLLPFLWPPVVAAVAAGGVLLARRSPGAAAGLAAYFAMIVAWPFRDTRLLAPIVPLAALCLVLAGRALIGAAGRNRIALGLARGLAITWLIGYAAGAGSRLLDPESTMPQAIRTRQLEGAVAATAAFTEPGAVVGAPELWPAIPLHTASLGAPSAPFRPGARDRPSWGRPEDQYRVWAAARLEYLVTEDGGAIHGAALDRLDAACPGALRVLARWEGQALVRLGWGAACRARLLD